VGDVDVGLVVVGADPEVEQRIDAVEMKLAQRRHELLLVADAGDALELRGDALGPVALDGGLVHARAVEGSETRHLGVGIGVGNRAFENLVERGLVLVAQRVEPAVARLVAGDVGAVEPLAAREPIEVLAGVGGFVHHPEYLGGQRSGLGRRNGFGIRSLRRRGGRPRVAREGDGQRHDDRDGNA